MNDIPREGKQGSLVSKDTGGNPCWVNTSYKIAWGSLGCCVPVRSGVKVTSSQQEFHTCMGHAKPSSFHGERRWLLWSEDLTLRWDHGRNEGLPGPFVPCSVFLSHEKEMVWLNHGSASYFLLTIATGIISPHGFVGVIRYANPFKNIWNYWKTGYLYGIK